MGADLVHLAQPQQRPAARDALRVAGKAAVPALVLHLQGRIKGDPSTAVQLPSAISSSSIGVGALARLWSVSSVRA